jgi:hypothetical protein
VPSSCRSVEPVVSVQTALLRAQMPDVVLRPGSTVMARVASVGEQHGVLVLAGIPLTAQLPREIAAGATLKLRVEEVSPERVVLRLDQTPLNPLAAQPPSTRADARVRVQDPPRRRTDAEGGGARVTLAFESAALGRLDLRIDLATRRVDVAVAAQAGRAFQLADAGAERLRTALEASTGLPANVQITQRREPLDLYA